MLGKKERKGINRGNPVILPSAIDLTSRIGAQVWLRHARPRDKLRCQQQKDTWGEWGSRGKLV